MTTNEIRALVAQKIAGQGSAVDVGGGLPAILNAICDALDATPSADSIPKPIIMSEMPAVGDTMEDLASKGLPPNEVKAAAEGKRTGVIDSQGFYIITDAGYNGDNDWKIIFYQCFFDNAGAFSGTGYYVYVSGGKVYVTVYEV